MVVGFTIVLYTNTLGYYVFPYYSTSTPFYFLYSTLQTHRSKPTDRSTNQLTHHLGNIYRNRTLYLVPHTSYPSTQVRVSIKSAMPSDPRNQWDETSYILCT